MILNDGKNHNVNKKGMPQMFMTEEEVIAPEVFMKKVK